MGRMQVKGSCSDGKVAIDLRIVEEVHRLANEHRAKAGLPEWDFSLLASEQWWKKIPVMNALVERLLLKQRKAKSLKMTAHAVNRDLTIPSTGKDFDYPEPFKTGVALPAGARAQRPRTRLADDPNSLLARSKSLGSR